MEIQDRTLMLDCLKELHYFSRSILSQSRGSILTNSELELLSLVHTFQENCTPLSLSHQTGMKKEAVSRGLRHLFEKGWIQKQVNPKDERSYILYLTDEGKSILSMSYDSMLRPLCELRQSMGVDFARLFELLHIANTMINPK